MNNFDTVNAVNITGEGTVRHDMFFGLYPAEWTLPLIHQETAAFPPIPPACFCG